MRNKLVPIAAKVIASVFWDSSGILLIDQLPKGQTFTGDMRSPSRKIGWKDVGYPKRKYFMTITRHLKKCNYYGLIGRIVLWIDGISYLFSWFGTVKTLLFWKMKKFCVPRQEWVRFTGKMLDQVYWCFRGLCWIIK